MTAPVRLTSLTLRNFKAIGDEPQTITFAPITLLFGPNSAGKSTILHALHYTREILCHRNLDPHHILDDALDLGGFRSFVHNHDLDRTISMTLAFKTLGDLPPPDWWPDAPDYEINQEAADNRQEIAAALRQVREFSIAFDIRWSHIEDQQRPYVSRYAVTIGGERFATIEASPDLKRVELVNINVSKQPFWTDELLSLFARGCGCEAIERAIGLTAEQRKEFVSELAHAIAFHNLIHPKQILPIAVYTDRPRDALPLPGQPLRFALRLTRDKSTDDAAKADAQFSPTVIDTVWDALNIGLVWLGEMASRAIDDWLHIGPLRSIPVHGPRQRQKLLISQWFDGEAAWHVLSNADENLIAEANRWLSGEDRLNTGYALELERFRRVPLDDPLWLMIGRGELIEDQGELRSRIASFPIVKQIRVRRQGAPLALSFPEVGVGLSQLIPIVVAAVSADTKGRLLAIEQPELHNHPAIQVALGDLFIVQALHTAEAEAARAESDEVADRAAALHHQSQEMLPAFHELRAARELKERDLRPLLTQQTRKLAAQLQELRVRRELKQRDVFGAIRIPEIEDEPTQEELATAEAAKEAIKHIDNEAKGRLTELNTVHREIGTILTVLEKRDMEIANSTNAFLIETHSEHLILRLLRRIRETAEGELPPGAPALKPDDIAVHYVEPTADGVRVKHLRVNDKGDFLDRWPRGFFEERGDELFS